MLEAFFWKAENSLKFSHSFSRYSCLCHSHLFAGERSNILLCMLAVSTLKVKAEKTNDLIIINTTRWLWESAGHFIFTQRLEVWGWWWENSHSKSSRQLFVLSKSQVVSIDVRSTNCVLIFKHRFKWTNECLGVPWKKWNGIIQQNQLS